MSERMEKSKIYAVHINNLHWNYGLDVDGIGSDVVGIAIRRHKNKLQWSNVYTPTLSSLLRLLTLLLAKEATNEQVDTV